VHLQAQTAAGAEKDAERLATQWQSTKSEATTYKTQEDQHWEKAKKLGNAADEGRRCAADDAEQVAREVLKNKTETSSHSEYDVQKAAKVTHIDGGKVTSEKTVTLSGSNVGGKGLSGAEVQQAIGKAVRSEE
jgi:hypothetical protein